MDAIFTRIGAADDLAGGRSTFMVEMTESANILHNATRQSFVLMDEVGRGTSTFDGLALAWAIARQLAEKNQSYTLFATHYFELTRLADEYREVANVHLDAVEHKDRIVFLHAVEEGPAVAELRYPGRSARRHPGHGGQSSPQASGISRIAGRCGAAAGRSVRNPRACSTQGTGGAGPSSVGATAQLEPDSLSPREALELLYTLARLARDGG